MIIGNPIMVGGGGNNISSIVITGLSSTDTVTCTKDGKSYTPEWDETDQHWEIVGVPLGTFTVTAANGAKTATETVLIDIVGVYEIEMNYRLYLYKDGDECSDVTGGYDEGLYNYSSSYKCKATWTKNADTLSSPKPGYPNCYVQTFHNSFDVSNYSKMCIEGTYNGVTTAVSRDISDLTGSLYAMIIHLQSNASSSWVALGLASQKSNFSTGTTYRDVELLNGITGTVYVNKVWLE